MKKCKKKVPQKATINQAAKFMQQINLNAAGIDIGSFEHYVAVPGDRDETPVRAFGAFTEDLHAIVKWLKKCHIDTVAMESTGVYWIPLYDLLEQNGIEVFLVNARHVKNVSGRKSDVEDCQWLQQLHSFGLLQGSFRPTSEIVTLRGYVRQREKLIEQMSSHILRMQKSLSLMNIQLHNVVRDITGLTGMMIIRDIIKGERDPKKLASYRDRRCANSEKVIAKSLEGTYKEDALFALEQAVDFYDFCQKKIEECDLQIRKLLSAYEDKATADEITAFEQLKFRSKRKKNNHTFGVKEILFKKTGVDLTAIPGIEEKTAITIISEIGTDMNKWKSEKHFASWAGLAPENKISGGKMLSSGTKPSSNKVGKALRLAAFTLMRSKCALGAFFRRLKSRIGAPKAITALARKLACIVYHLLKEGKEYVEQGEEYYEKQYHKRTIKSLRKRAQQLGYDIIEKELVTA